MFAQPERTKPKRRSSGSRRWQLRELRAFGEDVEEPPVVVGDLHGRGLGRCAEAGAIELDQGGSIGGTQGHVIGGDRQHGDGDHRDEALDRLGHVAGREHRQLAVLVTVQARLLGGGAARVDHADEHDPVGRDLADGADHVVGERLVVARREHVAGRIDLVVTAHGDDRSLEQVDA